MSDARFLRILLLIIASAGTAAAQIEREILWHAEQKARIAREGAQGLAVRGLDLSRLDAEMCAIYVKTSLSEAAASRLGERGVEIIPDIFVPAVPGRHPHGFHVARIPYAELERVAAERGVVRIDSLEHHLEPQTDLARTMIKADLVESGTGVTVRTGLGVKVAIADSGLDVTHPDIPAPVETFDVTTGATAAQWSTIVTNQVTFHGTHGTSIIAGSGGLSAGQYRGLAQGVGLHFYKIGNNVDAGATDADVIKALSRAQTVGCRIFNLGYGGWDATLDGSNALCQAFDAATAAGMTIISSAGNAADKKWHESASLSPAGGTATRTYSMLNFSFVPFTAQQQFELIWRDASPGDYNVTLVCTNLGPGETFSMVANRTTNRGTESQTYVLTPNLAPLAQKTYILQFANGAAAGAATLAHAYRTIGSGSFDVGDPTYTLFYPGLADTCIQLGAIAHRTNWINFAGQGFNYNFLTVGLPTPYSSIGPRVDGAAKPDIAAPGDVAIAARDGNTATNLLFVIDNDGINNGQGPANYYCDSGTTVAVAMTTGCAALLLEAAPLLTPAQVKAALIASAAHPQSPSPIDGAGLIDIRGAILSVDQKPLLSILSPSSANLGGAGFTMLVNGADFRPYTQVLWNGAPLATTFVSTSQLAAFVPPTLIATLGQAQVSASTAGGIGGGASNALPFGIQASGWAQPGQAVLDEFGAAVAVVGRIDTDPNADVVVGAPGSNAFGADSGDVRVYSGASGALIRVLATGATAGDRFGAAVAGLADVNADGRDEIIVGAPFDDVSGPDSGSVKVFDGQTGIILYTVAGAAGGDNLGTSVTDIGDVDLDGKRDIAAGAVQSTAGGVGYVRIYSGASGQLIHTFNGTNLGDRLGISVAACGDINLDGVPDILVGASGLAGSGPGYAKIFSGASGQAIRTIGTVLAPESFAVAVAGTADLDGDGRRDYMIGGGSDLGLAVAATVYSAASGLAIRSVPAGQAGDEYGRTLADAGDMNDDGFGDLILGAAQTGVGPGYVRVLSGLDLRTLASFTGFAAGSRLGASVSGAGDTDGDGAADIAIGSPGDTRSGVAAGAVDLYRGTAALYRGSRADFLMLTGLGLAPVMTGGGAQDVKSVQGFDLLTVSMRSVYGTFDFQPPFLVAHAYFAANPPAATPGFPELHVNAFGAVIVFGGYGPPFGQILLAPGGISTSFVIPPGIGGANVMLQGIVVTSAAPNGFFVTSDGHEIVLL